MYLVASESTEEIGSEALRPGSVTGRGPSTAPVGAHAYHAGTGTTLCGRKIASLHTAEFPSIDFETIAPRLRCEDCQAGIDNFE